MQASRIFLITFVVLVLFFGGMTGFRNSENITTAESFHAAVAALTFSSDGSGYSEQGKMLNSILSLASIIMILWLLVNLRGSDAPEFKGSAEDYFRLLPQDEDLILKEVRISAKSETSGKSKFQILERSGSMVMAVKKTRAFQLNVPFEKKLPAGTTVLAFGTESQLREFEKLARKNSATK